MTTAYEFCKVECDGHVLTVTIDRPEVTNALHGPANLELNEVFDEFDSDPGLWVAVVTGAGDKAFCAGNDLKATAAGKRAEFPESGFGGLTHRFDCIKPLIAAVNGVAMGGGFEIALACDIIIASNNAVFALPEPRVGLAALAGGMHRLPRKIGLARAMPLLLTGRRVGAEEGKALGFVAEVAPKDELMTVVKRWTDDILECSPLSLRATKQTVMKGLDAASLRDAMARERDGDAVQTLFASEDFRKGPIAFVEKRKPKWKGR